MTQEFLEHNIKWDKTSNPFNDSSGLPKIAQFSISTTNLKSMVPRYNNVFGTNNKAKTPRLKPPYRKRDLDRFEDCFRSDGTVKNAITKKWNFILGSHTSVSLDVNKEYQDDKLRAQAFQQVIQYEPYKIACDKANQILRKINFRKVIHAAGIQASVYGRACIEVVRDPADNNRICQLNVLNSKLLGDVEVEEGHWEFLGVHYRDLPRNDDLLEKENIIYITRNDYHVSPGSMYYGLSDLEAVIDGSETKRIIKQEDLKEIARSLWAGFGWLQFMDPNITYEQMKQVIENMKAGAWTATDHSVSLNVQEIAQNAPMLLEIIDAMNLETLRDIGIPSPLVGYENKQNYSNLVQTVVVFKEAELDAERRWLTDLIESQVLNDIFKKEMEAQGIQYDPYNGGQELVTMNTTTALNDQPLNPLQPNGLQIQTPQVIPPAKLTIDISDPDFTPYKEKMEIDLQLFDKQLISARKLLERAGMEDQVEETEARLEANRIRQEQMFGMQTDIFRQEVAQKDEIVNSKKQILGKLNSRIDEITGNGKPNKQQQQSFKGKDDEEEQEPEDEYEQYRPKFKGKRTFSQFKPPRY